MLLCTKILRFKEKQIIKVQMKCFFIAEFERAAKIKKDGLLPFLNISSSSKVIKVVED